MPHHMKNKITIIGAGINGLVAANYLQRAGFQVSLIERKSRLGGAVSTDFFKYKGRKITYPNGASVLGFMQDFVFRETGLNKYVSVYLPKHPEIVCFEQGSPYCLIYENLNKLQKEFAEKWNENGKVREFFADMERVVNFLRQGYRKAEVPTVELANKVLGVKLVNLWIKGSAKNLLNHYLTSERAKVFLSISATESGPVALSSPYSAFSIPLMASGSIFGGRWGYVKGGIWQITDSLGQINKKLGVKIITSAKVIDVSQKDLVVRYEKSRKIKKLESDYVIFATDPLTAARTIRDKNLVKKISKKQLVGSSGKLVMAFKKPVEWTDNTGLADFEMAMRYFISTPTLKAMDESSMEVKTNKVDFSPGYFEIYCEGAGDRKLGGKRNYDLISVFFTNLSFAKKGLVLPKVKKYIEQLVLSKIENKKDLIKSVLLTPKDLQELFYFPFGNIDHVDVSNGQTFFSRNYSPNPKANFYQFGNNKNIFYCAAGAYPCGSVAGTPGYMCAKQIIKAVRKTALC